MYNTYRAIFTLESGTAFMDRPIFDALLAYCYLKELWGYIPQKTNLTASELAESELLLADMPIERNSQGWWYGSSMFWDAEMHAEHTAKFYKRWANEHDHLADFGKTKRKIRISAGEFKSYGLNINVHQLTEVWFVFRSDNPDAVSELLKKHLRGLGKKNSQGYGMVKKVVVEMYPEQNIFETQCIRPIPIMESNSKLSNDSGNQYMRYKPPYWATVDMVNCYIPLLHTL